MYLIINISLFICNRRVRHISLVNFGFAIVASTSSLRDQSVCTIAMCGLWLLLQFTLVVVALNIVVCIFAAATSSFFGFFSVSFYISFSSTFTPQFPVLPLNVMFIFFLQKCIEWKSVDHLCCLVYCTWNMSCEQ